MLVVAEAMEALHAHELDLDSISVCVRGPFFLFGLWLHLLLFSWLSLLLWLFLLHLCLLQLLLEVSQSLRKLHVELIAAALLLRLWRLPFRNVDAWFQN